MKHKILISCISALAALGLCSCNDFLTENPQGVLAPETFFTSQNDLDMSVYALMAQTQAYQQNTNMFLVDCQGDDVTSSVGGNKAAYLSADGFNIPSDEKGITQKWNALYKIVKAANEVVNHAEQTPTTKEEINIALGQGYFWRAMAYFELVRWYGPCVLNLTNEPDNNQSPLSDEAAVYAQIEKDLLAADALNLPSKYSGAPRNVDGVDLYITDSKVKALLATVYMHMAGFPLNDTSKYADAAKYAKQVIDGVNGGKYNYSVVAWDQVYNFGNNFNNGCVLGLYYSYAQWGWWSASDSQQVNSHTNMSLWKGWGDFIPERKFWAEFPEGPRKDNVYAKQILLDGNFNTADGSYLLVDWWATQDGQPIKDDRSNEVVPRYQPMFCGYTVNMDDGGKAVEAPFDYTKPIYGGMTGPKTHQLIRYSEVLCWYAEAVGRGGSSDVAGARAALKQVYQAAYAGDAAKIASVDNLSGDALAQAAFKEHGWEVAGNTCGLVTRRSDVLRMNMLESIWKYRSSAAEQAKTVLVPAGTVTQSARLVGDVWEPFTYTLTKDVTIAENYGPGEVAKSWEGKKSIYMPYPSTETAKNPNLVH